MNINLFAQAQIEKKQRFTSSKMKIVVKHIEFSQPKIYGILWNWISTGQMWQVELNQKKSSQLETPINSFKR
jgi:hypothetical protein